MDSIKSNAKAHLGIAMALFGFWSVDHKVGIFVIAVIFLVSAILMFCSLLRFRTKWLKATGEILASCHVSHLVLFLGLVGLAIALIQTGYLVAGIVLLYIAYAFLGYFIGRDLGDAFKSLWHKLRHRKAN